MSRDGTIAVLQEAFVVFRRKLTAWKHSFEPHFWYLLPHTEASIKQIMGGLFLEAIFKRLLVCIFGMAQSDFWPLAAIGADGNSRCFMHSPSPSVLSERHYRPNSLRISKINLKFGGVMHSTMKQTIIYKGHARPILRVPWNLGIFHDRLTQVPTSFQMIYLCLYISERPNLFVYVLPQKAVCFVKFL